MSFLSTSELQKRLFSQDLRRRLVVSPILSDNQISNSTIDLRIANEFIVPKRNEAAIFDPLNQAEMRSSHLRSEKQYLSIGDRFFLHPNKIVLAGTIEYISMPTDLTGRIQARASYERLGLHVSTLANPGYKGSLTLSLVNIGNSPIVLYPGLRVAQMTVFQVTDFNNQDDPYRGKYRFEIGPMFSRAHEDPELELIKAWNKE